mmetsp:Transcript_27717/g.64203  ORF Transcript_27717/g.64203 Transcript_27717/m.64203 type:complete len:249 (-) Transcript_27717:84-830(-)
MCIVSGVAQQLGGKIKRGRIEFKIVLVIGDHGQAGKRRRGRDFPSCGFENGLRDVVEGHGRSEAALDFHNDSVAVVFLSAVQTDTKVHMVRRQAANLRLDVVISCIDRPFPQDVADPVGHFARRRMRTKDSRAFKRVEFRQNRSVMKIPSLSLGRYRRRGSHHGSTSSHMSRCFFLWCSVDGRTCVKCGTGSRVEGHGLEAWSEAANTPCRFFTNVIINVHTDVHGHPHARECRERGFLLVVVTHLEL